MAISRLAISLPVAQHLHNQTAQHQQMAEPAVSKAQNVQTVAAIVVMLPRGTIPPVAEHYSAPVAPAMVAWTGLTVAQSRRVIIPPVAPHQKSPRTVFPVANAAYLSADVLQPVAPRQANQQTMTIVQQVVFADLQVRVIIPPVAEPYMNPKALGMDAWTVMNVAHATKKMSFAPVAVHQNTHARQENTAKYLAQMTPN